MNTVTPVTRHRWAFIHSHNSHLKSKPMQVMHFYPRKINIIWTKICMYVIIMSTASALGTDWDTVESNEWPVIGGINISFKILDVSHLSGAAAVSHEKHTLYVIYQRKRKSLRSFSYKSFSHYIQCDELYNKCWLVKCFIVCYKYIQSVLTFPALRCQLNVDWCKYFLTTCSVCVGLHWSLSETNIDL